jgi:tRNA-binding protein
VGKVVAVVPFREARWPALRITADFGDLGHLRTSAQITNYDEAGFVGPLIVGVVNLSAKRVSGFISEFLVLGAIDEHGVVALLHTDDGARPGDRFLRLSARPLVVRPGIRTRTALVGTEVSDPAPSPPDSAICAHRSPPSGVRITRARLMVRARHLPPGR